MSTPAQIAANRENSKLSRGPVTDAGKAASSSNARTHGLNSADPVLPTEDRNQFNELLEAYRSDFEPNTTHQDFLVDQMVAACWKLDRLERLENEMLAALPDPAQAFTDDETAKKFARLERYRAGLERTYYRSVRELRAAQREEFQIEAKARQVLENQRCNEIRQISEAPVPAALREALDKAAKKYLPRTSLNKTSS